MFCVDVMNYLLVVVKQVPVRCFSHNHIIFPSLFDPAPPELVVDRTGGRGLQFFPVMVGVDAEVNYLPVFRMVNLVQLIVEGRLDVFQDVARSHGVGAGDRDQNEVDYRFFGLDIVACLLRLVVRWRSQGGR